MELDNLNTLSIYYTYYTLDFLYKRSMVPTYIKLKYIDRKKENYVTIDNFKDFLSQLKSIYIAQSTLGFYGMNILRLDDLELDITNLSKYQAKFNINHITKSINFKETKILNNFTQDRIDVEIDRYKQLAIGELKSYNINIDSIKIPDLPEDIYVDSYYVDLDYVYPQIN